MSCHCGKHPLHRLGCLGRPRRRIRFRIPFFHDGTERLIQRPGTPATQRAYYSGKKKQHTVKNLLIINDACKVVLLTPSFEGCPHDKRIADSTGYDLLPKGGVLYQDTCFQGFCLPGITITQPNKKPRGRALSSIRIRVEHAIGGIKRYRIVKEKLRNWKTGFSDIVMEACCGLHNFRLNFRPWCYQTLVD